MCQIRSNQDRVVCALRHARRENSQLDQELPPAFPYRIPPSVQRCNLRGALLAAFKCVMLMIVHSSQISWIAMTSVFQTTLNPPRASVPPTAQAYKPNAYPPQTPQPPQTQYQPQQQQQRAPSHIPDDLESRYQLSSLIQPRNPFATPFRMVHGTPHSKQPHGPRPPLGHRL